MAFGATVHSNTDPKGLSLLHVALVGDLAVGKTSLIRRIADDTFTPTTSYDTVGEFQDVPCRVRVNDKTEQKMLVRLYDTCGMEREGACLTSNFYRNKDGIILTWDIRSEETYRRLSTWEETVSSYYVDYNMPAFIVVANKAENFRESDSKIYEKCLDHYATKRISCFKTSAQNGDNVKQAFEELLNLMAKSYTSKRDEKSQTVHVDMLASTTDHPGKNSCCRS